MGSFEKTRKHTIKVQTGFAKYSVENRFEGV